MNALIEKCGGYWSDLSERDQKTLILALPIVLVLLVYLTIFQPIQNRYSEAKEQHHQLSESLVWLYDNATLVDRMQNLCARQRLAARGDDSLAQFVQNIGRRAGAVPQVESSSGGGFVTKIQSAAGNRALALIQSYSCHGFVVSDIQMTRRSETGSDVDLTIKLSASSVLEGI